MQIDGQHFTSLTNALATEFSPAEIEHATDRGLCGQHSLLLACIHLGHTFANTWLSVGLLRVLRSLQDTHQKSVLTFISTQTRTSA